MSDETILQEAQRLVHGDRGRDYGHPIDDYTRTGRMWGAILGIGDIDPRICCLMMAAVKISREVNAPKRDNRTDLAGYAECTDMVAQRQAELAATPPRSGPSDNRTGSGAESKESIHAVDRAAAEQRDA